MIINHSFQCISWSYLCKCRRNRRKKFFFTFRPWLWKKRFDGISFINCFIDFRGKDFFLNKPVISICPSKSKKNKEDRVRQWPNNVRRRKEVSTKRSEQTLTSSFSWLSSLEDIFHTMIFVFLTQMIYLIVFNQE